MSSRSWLSKDQQNFISDHVPKFREAKAKGTKKPFYNEFYASWFAKFLEMSSVFPNVKMIDDLSTDDKEELEWYIERKKAVH
jgi:hypothetical protein